MEDKQLEQLLTKALSSTVEPSEDLNLIIKNRVKENKTMKPVHKRMAVALIAAAIFIMSGSAFAAWQLLSPKQVAEKLGDKALAKAFDSENAIQINESVTSGDYTFTLHGITYGENLSDFKSSARDILPDRTYAVVSIAKKDGTSIAKAGSEDGSEDYQELNFIVSSLIKGQKPWQVNIFTMNGGYSECVVDGVIYRMVDCDNIEMFADRGVYLYVGTGIFINNQTVNYNEETGEITLNENSKEAGALFDLPLDVNKADHEKAQKYLKELFPESSPESSPSDFESAAEDSSFVDWEDKLDGAVVIPESIKEVTCDENGYAYYEYNGDSLSFLLDSLLDVLESGEWKTVRISDDDKQIKAIQFSKDENDVIIGRTLSKSK